MTIISVFLIILSFLSSCSGSENKQLGMQAQNTASQTRAHWEQAKKSFVISFEDDKNFNEPLSLGVYVLLADATQEERTALDGVVFYQERS